MMRSRLLLCMATAALWCATPDRANAQCPVTSTPTNDCSWGDMINAFSFNNVASTGSSGACPGGGYISFTQTFSATIGQTVPWTASVGNAVYQQGVAIWIDINNNGSYENSEMLSSSNYALTHSSTLTIPTTAVAATVKMRVRCAYFYNISSSEACTNNIGSYGETEDYNITLISPCLGPTITAQPQSTNYCIGGMTGFTVAATSAATYQWQVDAGNGFTNITNNSNYSGATTNSLSISNIPANFNNYKYRCRTVSACGTPTNSAQATLTMHPLVKVTKQTQNAQACEEASTSVFVSASGPVSGYRWQYGTLTNGFVDVPNHYPFAGVTDSMLQILFVPDTLAGLNFRCIVSGPCTPDTSHNIYMNVILGPYIAEAPHHDTVQPYTNGLFQVIAAGTDYQVYWQSSSDGGGNFVNINDNSLYTGTKSTTLTVNAPPASLNGMQFRCILKSVNPACGSLYDTSDAATLFVGNFTSVKDMARSANVVSLYPNPASDMLYMSSDALSGMIQVRVTDQVGRVVLTDNISFSNGKGALPVQQLPAGVYLLRIATTDGVAIPQSKFIKQ